MPKPSAPVSRQLTICAINKIVKVISLKRFVCHLISLMAKVSCWKLWKIRSEEILRRIHSRTSRPFINHILISANSGKTCPKLFWKGDQKNLQRKNKQNSPGAFPNLSQKHVFDWLQICLFAVSSCRQAFISENKRDFLSFFSRIAVRISPFFRKGGDGRA